MLTSPTLTPYTFREKHELYTTWKKDGMHGEAAIAPKEQRTQTDPTADKSEVHRRQLRARSREEEE